MRIEADRSAAGGAVAPVDGGGEFARRGVVAEIVEAGDHTGELHARGGSDRHLLEHTGLGDIDHREVRAGEVEGRTTGVLRQRRAVVGPGRPEPATGERQARIVAVGEIMRRARALRPVRVGDAEAYREVGGEGEPAVVADRNEILRAGAARGAGVVPGDCHVAAGRVERQRGQETAGVPGVVVDLDRPAPAGAVVVRVAKIDVRVGIALPVGRIAEGRRIGVDEVGAPAFLVPGEIRLVADAARSCAGIFPTPVAAAHLRVGDLDRSAEGAIETLGIDTRVDGRARGECRLPKRDHHLPARADRKPHEVLRAVLASDPAGPRKCWLAPICEFCVVERAAHRQPDDLDRTVASTVEADPDRAAADDAGTGRDRGLIDVRAAGVGKDADRWNVLPPSRLAASTMLLPVWSI